MLVDVDGLRFRFTFKYSPHGTVTTCLIDQHLVSVHGDDDVWGPVCTGVVKRYSTDRANKVIARKNALTKALKASLLSKSQRTAIWDKFKETCKYIT